jgi:hypothetical protein
VSLKYFQAFDQEVSISLTGSDIQLTNEQKIEEMQEVLLKSKSSFKAMPLSDSQESKKLRTAYAQQIISSAVYDYVLQPFSIEGAPLSPNVLQCLSDISSELARTDHGRRSFRVSRMWTAITIRGLNSLARSKYSDSTPNLYNNWIANVTEEVVAKLLPPADPAQEINMKADVAQIIKDAMTLWKKGQVDELQLTASLNLDIKQRDIWRSQSLDSDTEAQPDIESSTPPRVFTLFPCITAVPCIAESTVTTKQAVVIHHGSGVPEYSSWVIGGMEEEMSRLEYIDMATKQAKRESYQKSKGWFNHSRRGSTATIATTPRVSMAKTDEECC